MGGVSSTPNSTEPVKVLTEKDYKIPGGGPDGPLSQNRSLMMMSGMGMVLAGGWSWRSVLAEKGAPPPMRFHNVPAAIIMGVGLTTMAGITYLELYHPVNRDGWSVRRDHPLYPAPKHSRELKFKEPATTTAGSGSGSGSAAAPVKAVSTANTTK